MKWCSWCLLKLFRTLVSILPPDCAMISLVLTFAMLVRKEERDKRFRGRLLLLLLEENGKPNECGFDGRSLSYVCSLLLLLLQRHVIAEWAVSLSVCIWLRCHMGVEGAEKSSCWMSFFTSGILCLITAWVCRPHSLLIPVYRVHHLISERWSKQKVDDDSHDDVACTHWFFSFSFHLCLTLHEEFCRLSSPS